MAEMVRAVDLWMITPGCWISGGRVAWQFLGVIDRDGPMVTVSTPAGARQVHKAQLLWISDEKPEPHGRRHLARQVAEVRVRVPHGRKPGRQYLRKVSARVIAALVERDGPGCHYCGRDLDAERAMAEGHTGQLPLWWPTRDHKHPRAAGGVDSLENLLLSCWVCNNDKGDTPYEEYVAELAARGLGPLTRAEV